MARMADSVVARILNVKDMLDPAKGMQTEQPPEGLVPLRDYLKQDSVEAQGELIDKAVATPPVGSPDPAAAEAAVEGAVEGISPIQQVMEATGGILNEPDVQAEDTRGMLSESFGFGNFGR